MATLGQFFLLTVLVSASVKTEAQQKVLHQKELTPGEQSIKEFSLHKNSRTITIGDTVLIFLGNCKNSFVLTAHPDTTQILRPAAIAVQEKKTPFIKVHGNILYNFNYRSYIDTPFTQTGLVQNMVQTSLNFVIKEKYPVKMLVTHRNSNSPYFKDLTDVNLQFDRRQLLDNIKARLREKASTLVGADVLNKTEQLYNNRQQQYQQLKTWVNSPARAKELIEAKEQALKQSVKSGDLSQVAGNEEVNKALPVSKIAGLKSKFNSKSIKDLENKIEDSAKLLAKQKQDELLGKDSSAVKDSTIADKYAAKKKQLDSLAATVKQYEAKVKSDRKAVKDSLNKIKSNINSINSTSGLYAFMKEHNISKDSLSKTQRILLAINTIGIGRCFVDHSELTVKNVSLSGINVEAEPGRFYVAFAAGKINYRFRDFIIKDNKTLPDQSLYMVRAGLGKKEGNNLIFSFYNGKKAILNYTPGNDPASVQRVLGISAEARLGLDKDNYLIAEVASSSYNSPSNTNPPTSALVKRAFDFRSNTNRAYSIKLFTSFPLTNTRFTGYYKKIGENFQSYNLYPVNVDQDAWLARIQQQLWKNRLLLDASIRKNDFVSPIAAPSLQNKTIFRSLQATLRVPKYPFISIGYYPTSQLSLSNDNLLYENQYNTLNIISGYGYRIGKAAMNTNAMLTRFYNNSSDTGFIYFNALSYTIDHSIYLKQLSLETSASISDQKALHIFTLEQIIGYQVNNIINVRGGVKWNRVNASEDLYGGTASVSLVLKKLGTIQLNYDKTFLPGYDRNLKPVDMGRMTFYRIF